MPKAFDPAEREAIRASLMNAGLRRFARAGVRAVRVDDICRDVGIAKGSFYAFFPTKEDLFMAIVDEREGIHRRDMLAFIEDARGTETERVGRFFDLIIEKIETDPVLNIVVVNDEISHLTRKLGPERMAQSQAADRAFMRQVVRHWQRAGGTPIDPKDLLGLMTLCLSLAVQRNQMTAGQYRPTLALLREMFISRLLGATK